MYARTVYIVEIEQLGYDVYIVQYKTRVAALNISDHGVYVHQSAVYIRKKTISIDNIACGIRFILTDSSNW